MKGFSGGAENRLRQDSDGMSIETEMGRWGLVMRWDLGPCGLREGIIMVTVIWISPRVLHQLRVLCGGLTLSISNHAGNVLHIIASATMTTACALRRGYEPAGDEERDLGLTGSGRRDGREA